MRSRLAIFVCIIIAIFYIIGWYYIGFKYKKKIVSLLNIEDTHYSIEYDKLRLTNFPFNWAIDIIEPQINYNFNSNNLNISTEIIRVNLNYDFKRLRLVLDNNIVVKNNDTYYYLNSVKPTNCILINDESLFSKDDLSISNYRIIDNKYKLTDNYNLNLEILNNSLNLNRIYFDNSYRYNLYVNANLKNNDKDFYIKKQISFLSESDNIDFANLKQFEIKEFILDSKSSSPYEEFKLDVNGSLLKNINIQDLKGKFEIDMQNYLPIANLLSYKNILNFEKLVKYFYAISKQQQTILNEQNHEIVTLKDSNLKLTILIDKDSIYINDMPFLEIYKKYFQEENNFK